MARFTVGLSLCVLLAAPIGMAQVNPEYGVLPFSTNRFGVDLATGFVNISFPMRSKAGKIPFSSGMAGTSSAWPRIITSGPLTGKYQWFPSLVGTGQTQGFFYNDPTQLQLATNPVDAGGGCYDQEDVVVYDRTGASHPFAVSWYTGSCPTSASGVATDGSGYTIVVTTNGQPTVYDKNGNFWVGTCIKTCHLKSTVTDADGATITDGSTGGNNLVATDSLGQVVLTGTPVSGGSNWGSFSYTDINGTTQYYTLGYTTLPIATNFACSNPYYLGTIYEYTSTGTPLLTSITTPAGGEYSISYEPTPGESGSYTGRVAEITLPTGGSISYAYSGGNNGVNCNSFVVPTLTVKVYDNNSKTTSTWSYVNSNNSANFPGNFTVTETDPANNQTVHHFAGEFETLTESYQGGCPTSIAGCNGGGTELRFVTTCYNQIFSSCAAPSSVPKLPIFQTDVYTWTGMTPQSLVETIYDKNYGAITSVGRWNWGAPLPPTSLNLISTTYTPLGSWNGRGCVAIGNYINDRVCYKNVNDGSGALQSSETFNYSPQGHLLKHVAGTTTSGINGPTLTSQTSYNSNGTVNVFTDVNNAQTTYHYDGSCNSLLLTSVSEPLSLSRSMTWDCNGGVMKSSTDENSEPSTAAYTDPLWRITSATNQGYPATNYTYPDPNHFENYMNFNGSVSTVDTTTATDGLGRPILVQKKQGQGSSSFDSVQSQYGWTQNTGAFVKQSMPYSGSPSAWTTTQYDALGRVSSVTDGGGGTVTYTYNGSDVLQAASSPSVQKQLEYDALGRLTSVCEINSGTTAWPAVTCGQFNSTKGYWTTYTYNALGNLKSVTQNALGSATQTRNYYYDALGRLTQEVNPENGTTTYYWDAAAPSCGGGAYATPGDLGAKKDNAGVYTCY